MTEKLKQIYASNTVETKAYDTVELRHPNFTQTYYFVQDYQSHEWELEDGGLAVFEPFGFTIQKPKTGGPQQDMAFVFSNVMRLGVQELELAVKDIHIPITLVYRVYAEGYDFPQTDPITLHLTDVVASPETISAVASRTNLVQQKVPSRVFEPWVFKGLVS